MIIENYWETLNIIVGQALFFNCLIPTAFLRYFVILAVELILKNTFNKNCQGWVF